MQATIQKLNNIILDYTPKLEQIPHDILGKKTNPGKWSKLEILGHLADSAQNNLRRFLVAQYEENPKIVYRQDDWVALSGYLNYPPAELITLWCSLNKHMSMVLQNMPEANASRTCDTNNPEFHTIAWLAEDYVKHLLHHIHQVLDMEPVAYP